ncbi:MAG: hypothetical protein ACK415_13420 [Thermodesulfovibrionales bacterium]
MSLAREKTASLTPANYDGLRFVSATAFRAGMLLAKNMQKEEASIMPALQASAS